MKLAVSQVALGQALAATTPDEAEALLKKALNEQSALLAEYPDVPEYQLDWWAVATISSPSFF